MKSKFGSIALVLLVLSACGGASINSVGISADHTVIAPGATATLSATVTGSGTFDKTVTWSIVSGGGTLSAITGDSVTYTAAGVSSGTDVILKATSTADNTKTGNFTLKVLAKPAIASFIVSNPTLPGGGGSVNLSWNVSGADTLSIDQGVGTVTGTLKAVNVSKTTTYTLSATNAAGSTTATALVTVTALGTLDWVKQVGTSKTDQANSVVTDGSGNVYMGGVTLGAISGSNPGAVDAFLIKYDSSGNELWRRQLGTSVNDYLHSVATDNFGNVYLAGDTLGAMTDTNVGSYDAFLIKYDSSGSELWRRQLGTSSSDSAAGISTDANGNVYMAGYTFGALTGTNAGSADATLVKYDPSGNELWRRQLGTSSSDSATSVSTDGDGNVFIAGYTGGAITGTNAGSNDAFLIKYDSSGNELWRRQLGTSTEDNAYSVSTDGSGNVIISGITGGTITGISAGESDVFLIKYDSSGTELWRRQLGTSAAEYASRVATDGSGNVYITGTTSGAITGTNAGGYDVYLIKYGSGGTELWRKQLGTSTDDQASGVATDTSGNVFMAGLTRGAITGTNAGAEDAFLVRFR